MRGTVLYGPRDARFEEREDPRIIEPTDAIIRMSATCVRGSDLRPYRGVEEFGRPQPMGHEYCGVVEEVGAAVGLCAVLAAGQLGAERVIAMSRHEDRQKLAREFGATYIVTERGDEGASRIKELTGGLGAHSAVEAVGTQELMTQAVRSPRRPRRLRRGLPRPATAGRQAVLLRGATARRPRPGAPLPARAARPHMGPED